MSGMIEYVIKLNICIAVVYLFYRLALRRLTFYNWNRWYLLCYTALSFVIPLINIMPSLQKQNLHEAAVLYWIPTVNFHSATQGSFFSMLTQWDWVTGIVLTGSLVLLLRLVIRLYAFQRIKAKAQLISDGGTKIYQLDEDITPFSFGNAMFINTRLHDEQELEEIIRHEFVHIRQKHTIDILWFEWVCLLNWYNPVVWMLRHAVRQNLEFIADDKVLQNGVDKASYQYLLLKVVGNPRLAFTSHFNFSSLKKRIAMMNTLKTARIHLTRFVFLLPLAAVLLLSFRNETRSDNRSDNKTQVTSISLTSTGSNEQQISFNADTIMLELRDGSDLIPGKQVDTAIPVIPVADARPGLTTGNQDTLPRLMLRAVNDSSSNGAPLYLIDGRKVSAGGLQTTNPHQIESVTVLKGAAATAAYGSEAANGVVLITTKAGVGKTTTPTVTVTGYAAPRQADSAIGISKSDTAVAPILQVQLSDTSIAAAPVNTFPENLTEDVYYVVDGEKASFKKVRKLQGQDIKRVDVFKGDEARRFYGKKARNGAIVITTRK